MRPWAPLTPRCVAPHSTLHFSDNCIKIVLNTALFKCATGHWPECLPLNWSANLFTRTFLKYKSKNCLSAGSTELPFVDLRRLMCSSDDSVHIQVQWGQKWTEDILISTNSWLSEASIHNLPQSKLWPDFSKCSFFLHFCATSERKPSGFLFLLIDQDLQRANCGVGQHLNQSGRAREFVVFSHTPPLGVGPLWAPPAPKYFPNPAHLQVLPKSNPPRFGRKCIMVKLAVCAFSKKVTTHWEGRGCKSKAPDGHEVN